MCTYLTIQTTHSDVFFFILHFSVHFTKCPKPLKVMSGRLNLLVSQFCLICWLANFGLILSILPLNWKGLLMPILVFHKVLHNYLIALIRLLGFP